MKKNLTTVLFLICLSLQALAQIIHIPSDYSTIQAGINAASDGDTVLVAEGLYYENINFNGKAITVASHFLMDGDTSHISKTIIDGSKPAHPDTASVVLFVSGEDSTSVLNGFTITGGTGSLLTHEHFKALFKVGGGIAILNGGGKIINNKITGNTAYTDVNDLHAWGAGINSSTSIERAVVIRNNQIENNQTNSGTFSLGAGISAYNDKGYFLCENNTIANNKATTRGADVAGGGGVCMLSLSPWNATMILRNNLISQNEVANGKAYGGGIYFVIPVNDLNGVFNDQKSKMEIYNNVITKNKSSLYGGGISLVYSKSTFANAENPIPLIFNNTISGNVASNGTGIFNGNMKPLLFNNIFWNEGVYASSKEFYNENGTFVTFNNTIQGGYPGTGSIDQNPQLNSDLSLMGGSPSIGTGVDSVAYDGSWYFAPTYDFSGDSRPNMADHYVDLGAIESDFPRYDSETILNVPGKYQTIQSAIDAAADGDTVLVDEGLYYENINYNGKAITVASHFIMDGDTAHISKTVIDGSKATDPLKSSVVRFDNCKDTTSILQGFSITGGKGGSTYVNPYYVRGSGAIGIVNASGKVSNCSIYGNSLTSNQQNEYCYGGAIGIGNLTTAAYKVVIRKNKIFDNHINALKQARGGAIYADCRAGYITIENNNIYQNTAASNFSYEATGGGIYINKNNHIKAKLFIRNNTIHHNEINGPNAMGGGMHIQLTRYAGLESPSNYKPSEIYNNLIFSNTSEYYGGGIGIWNEGPQNGLPDVLPDPILSNNTIVNNHAKVGAGLFNYHSEVVLFNNIFWNDLSEKDCSELFNENLTGQSSNVGILHVSNNAIQGGYEGEGNINLDPQMNVVTFHLKEISPCIGKGTDAVTVEGILYKTPPYDFTGSIRSNPANTVPDIGAIESPQMWPVKVASVLENNKTIRVYPNPTSSKVTVHFTVATKQAVKLSIYNVLGQQEVGLLNEVRPPGAYDVEVDLSALRTGVYYMVLESHTKTTTKLIKQ